MAGIVNKVILLSICERFEPRSHFKSRLSLIVRVNCCCCCPIQDYVHPDDQTQPTLEMTPGFKPFTG